MSKRQDKPDRQPAFHKLVVGADGSDQAHDAVALGALIASAAGADISLLGVYSPALFPISGMTDRQTQQRAAERALQEELRRRDVAASTHTTSDLSMPRALSQHAERWNAELIVVGPGCNAAEGHASISPRCRQLLGGGRFGLAIARRGVANDKAQLRAIGVGYDAGPESELALKVAAGLAQRSGAELKALTVVDDRVSALGAGQWTTLSADDLESMWESRREQAGRKAQEAAQECGVAATVEAVCGDPGRCLRNFTKQLDLLVIGSRRWGRPGRALAGSVSESLLADSRCSLLMVPRPASSRRPRDDHSS